MQAPGLACSITSKKRAQSTRSLLQMESAVSRSQSRINPTSGTLSNVNAM